LTEISTPVIFVSWRSLQDKLLRYVRTMKDIQNHWSGNMSVAFAMAQEQQVMG